MHFTGYLRKLAMKGGEETVGLIPFFREDIPKLLKIPVNVAITVRVVRKRKLGKHNRAFKMMTIAFKNAPEHIKAKTFKAFYSLVKLEVGFVDYAQKFTRQSDGTMREEIFRMPRSMSFEECPDEDFDALYPLIRHFCADCLGTTPDILEDRLFTWHQEDDTKV